MIMWSLFDVELSESVKQQYVDNIGWIRQAHQHNLVTTSH